MITEQVNTSCADVDQGSQGAGRWQEAALSDNQLIVTLFVLRSKHGNRQQARETAPRTPSAATVHHISLLAIGCLDEFRAGTVIETAHSQA